MGNKDVYRAIRPSGEVPHEQYYMSNPSLSLDEYGKPLQDALEQLKTEFDSLKTALSDLEKSDKKTYDALMKAKGSNQQLINSAKIGGINDVFTHRAIGGTTAIASNIKESELYNRSIGKRSNIQNTNFVDILRLALGFNKTVREVDYRNAMPKNVSLASLRLASDALKLQKKYFPDYAGVGKSPDVWKWGNVGYFDKKRGDLLRQYRADTDKTHNINIDNPPGRVITERGKSIQDTLAGYIIKSKELRAKGSLPQDFIDEVTSYVNANADKEVRPRFSQHYYNTQDDLNLISYGSKIEPPRSKGKIAREGIRAFVSKFILDTYKGGGNNKGGSSKKKKEAVLEEVKEEAKEEVNDEVKEEVAKDFVEEIAPVIQTIWASDIGGIGDADTPPTNIWDSIYDSMNQGKGIDPTEIFTQHPIEAPTRMYPRYAPSERIIGTNPYGASYKGVGADRYIRSSLSDAEITDAINSYTGETPPDMLSWRRASRTSGNYQPNMDTLYQDYLMANGLVTAYQPTPYMINSLGSEYDKVRAEMLKDGGYINGRYIRSPNETSLVNNYSASAQSYAGVGASRYAQYTPNAPGSQYPIDSVLDILPSGTTEDMIDNFIKNAGKRYDKMVRGIKPKSWIRPESTDDEEDVVEKEQKAFASAINLFAKAASAFVAGVGAFVGGAVEGAGSLMSNTSIAPSAIISSTGSMLGSVGSGLTSAVSGGIKAGGAVGGAIGTALGGPAVGAIISGISSVAGSVVDTFGKIGSTLMKTITGFMTSTLKLLKKLAETSPVIKAIGDLFQLAFTMIFLPMFTALGSELLPSVLDFVTKAIQLGQEMSGILVGVFDTDTFKSFLDNLITLAGELIETFLPPLMELMPKFGDMITAFLNIFLDNAEAIISMFTTALDLFTYFLEDKSFIHDLIRILKLVLDIFNTTIVKDFLTTGVVVLVDIVEWMAKEFGGWSIIFDAIGKGVGALTEMVSSFVSSLTGSDGNGTFGINRWGTDILNVLGLSGNAEGGIVQGTPGGSLAWVGEGGQSEAIIPLDKLRDVTSSTTNGVTVVFYGDVYGMSDFEKKVKQVVNTSTTRGYYR